jgi:hypothetical protein
MPVGDTPVGMAELFFRGVDVDFIPEERRYRPAPRLRRHPVDLGPQEGLAPLVSHVLRPPRAAVGGREHELGVRVDSASSQHSPQSGARRVRRQLGGLYVSTNRGVAFIDESYRLLSTGFGEPLYAMTAVIVSVNDLDSLRAGPMDVPQELAIPAQGADIL